MQSTFEGRGHTFSSTHLVWVERRLDGYTRRDGPVLARFFSNAKSQAEAAPVSLLAIQSFFHPHEVGGGPPSEART